jgi:hypothetical protein
LEPGERRAIGNLEVFMTKASARKILLMALAAGVVVFGGFSP